LIDSDSLCWVKSKHLLDEINGIWISTLKYGLHVLSLSFWKTLNEFLIFKNGNLFD
jgi:hypothetical protein